MKNSKPQQQHRSPPKPSLTKPQQKTPSPNAPAKPTHWAKVADWYDTLVGDEGSEYHREVILPGILRLLQDHRADDQTKNQKNTAPPATKNILDFACGQGVLCRKLAALGHTLTGIDAAEPLIAAAKKRNDADRLPIRYQVADVTKLQSKSGDFAAALTPASFDAITLVLAIQNMTPLSPIWHACHNLLKPQGSLILIMMHPAFRIPKQSDWHWDPHTLTQSRQIRQYLSSSTIPIQTHPGLAAHGKDATTTTHFHRPLQAYINTLGNAGLLIDHIEEWPSHKKSESGPRQQALDHSRKEIPMFLALRARKV